MKFNEEFIKGKLITENKTNLLLIEKNLIEEFVKNNNTPEELLSLDKEELLSLYHFIIDYLFDTGEIINKPRINILPIPEDIKNKCVMLKNNTFGKYKFMVEFLYDI